METLSESDLERGEALARSLRELGIGSSGWRRREDGDWEFVAVVSRARLSSDGPAALYGAIRRVLPEGMPLSVVRLEAMGSSRS